MIFIVSSQESCPSEVPVTNRTVMIQLLHLIVPAYVTFEQILFGECFLAAITLELLLLLWGMENDHVPGQSTLVFERALTLQAVLLLQS